MPLLSAAGFPLLTCRTTWTPGSHIASTMSAVPSVEPSSMTMTSMGWSLSISERTVLAMHSRSLYAGTSTVTGSVTGSPQPKPRRRTLRACAKESTSISPNRPMTSTPITASPATSTAVVPSETATAPTNALPLSSSTPETGVWALGAPSASVRLANSYPRSCMLGRKRPSAVTVCERSPPESCISTMEPRVPSGVARSMISSTPGRFQSSLSVLLSTVM